MAALLLVVRQTTLEPAKVLFLVVGEVIIDYGDYGTLLCGVLTLAVPRFVIGFSLNAILIISYLELLMTTFEGAAAAAVLASLEMFIEETRKPLGDIFLD